MSTATAGADLVESCLSREQFRLQVFARSNGRCVICGDPVVDAHHILDRKLFADVGYRLDNGAAVCELHHWACETTEISVAVVRRAAVLPAFADEMDKWGNRIWPSGLRSAGPLMNDTGARRALAAGRVLHLVMPSSYREPEFVPAEGEL